MKMAPLPNRIASFLATTGWQDARYTALAGDASARRYLRLCRTTSGSSAVLMDAPRQTAGDIAPFVKIAGWLQSNGFSAPDILAQDRALGLVLLEDLGDDLYTRLCQENPEMERQVYQTATDLLAALATRPPPRDLLDYSPDIYLKEARLIIDWYLPAATGAALSATVSEEFETLVGAACTAITGDRQCVVLRDFHAENLLWLPGRNGLARVGLLDFQDALLGHPAYDLVSLLKDARRDTSPALQDAMISRYLAATGLEEIPFRQAYATLGAQRNLKIIGIFTRLYLRDGKIEYLDMIPRVWAHLMRDLKHPALSLLRRFVRRRFPAPVPDILQRIRAAST